MSTATTKADLAKTIAKNLDITIPTATACIDLLEEAIAQSLLAGKKVELRTFGTFFTKDAPANMRGRNPKTGETVEIPARRKAQFKPSGALKAALQAAKAAEVNA